MEYQSFSGRARATDLRFTGPCPTAHWGLGWARHSGRPAGGRHITVDTEHGQTSSTPLAARPPRALAGDLVATKVNPLLPHAVPEGKGVFYS